MHKQRSGSHATLRSTLFSHISGAKGPTNAICYVKEGRRQIRQTLQPFDKCTETREPWRQSAWSVHVGVLEEQGLEGFKKRTRPKTCRWAKNKTGPASRLGREALELGAEKSCTRQGEGAKMQSIMAGSERAIASGIARGLRGQGQADK